MANLPAQLAQLESEQLVRRSPEEELAYLFKHTLTQETVYESLLLKRRREIHRLVAEAYEELEVGRVDEFAALLAQHYRQAGDDAKTLEYSVRAGDRAARMYANTEAISHYTQALDIVKRLQENDGELLHIYSARGRAYELKGDYERALANYEDLAAEAISRGDRKLELAALMASATLHSTPTAKFDLPRAQELLEKALALAGELKDWNAEAKVLWLRMLLYRWTGRAAEAVRVGERAIEIARKFGLREQLAFTLNDIRESYIDTHQIERARAAGAEALALWRELDNKPMMIDSLIGSSADDYMAGNYDQALAVSAKAFQLSQAIGNLWGQSYSLMSDGPMYLDRGKIRQALETMQECARLGEEAGFQIAVLSQQCLIAMTWAWMGDPARGLELLSPAFDRSNSLGFAGATIQAVLALILTLKSDLDGAQAAVQECYKLIAEAPDPTTAVVSRLAAGELALAKQEYDRALQVADEMLTLLKDWDAKIFLTDALLIKCRAEMGLGRPDQAHATLTRARAEAEAIGGRRTMWEILAMRADMEEERGNSAAAAAMRQEAVQIVDYIAAHTPDDLRTCFLNLPPVRRLLTLQK